MTIQLALLAPPPFGWPSLAAVERCPPTGYLNGAAWVALYQADLRMPGLRRLWDLGRVHALAEQMRSGREPDAIEVAPTGDGYAISDGNHRAAAARALGRESIAATVRA